jgi:hypothetical protein
VIGFPDDWLGVEGVSSQRVGNAHYVAVELVVRNLLKDG